MKYCFSINDLTNFDLFLWSLELLKLHSVLSPLDAQLLVVWSDVIRSAYNYIQTILYKLVLVMHDIKGTIHVHIKVDVRLLVVTTLNIPADGRGKTRIIRFCIMF